MKQQCSICKDLKDLSLYWKNKKSKNGLQKHCKDCHKKMAHNWYLRHIKYCRDKGRITISTWRRRHPLKVKKLRKKYWKLHGERYKENNRKKNLLKKLEALKIYGGQCECCKESDYRFLTFDHINNDGKKHRKVNIYHYMKKHNYPKNLRILCFNCNYGRQIYGGIDKQCPHKSLSVNRVQD